MPPRATWKGHLKLSLITFGVRVYNATSSSSRIALNQLHKDCHQRLKQRMVCPEHGEIERSEIVKGYEFEKGRYVVVDPEELEKIQVETTKTIDITQFVDPEDIAPVYRNAPYYLAPDGPVADEAFSVIRTAMENAGRVAIGRFVIAGREHTVVIEPEGKGLRMTTLRSDAEVRAAEPYFEDIVDKEIDDGQLSLAEELVKRHDGELDTGELKDRYQEALLATIKAKIEGRDPVVVEAESPASGLNFMDALKQSVDAQKTAKKTKKPPAKSVGKTVRKKKQAE